MTENTELKVNFTDNELRSIALNAMARASEAGNTISYESFFIQDGEQIIP